MAAKWTSRFANPLFCASRSTRRFCGLSSEILKFIARGLLAGCGDDAAHITNSEVGGVVA